MALTADNIPEKAILFNLKQTVSGGLSGFELYEATRYQWAIDINRASLADYAIPHYDGQILEVYRIAQWFDAGSTQLHYYAPDPIKGRKEFVGVIAGKEIRDKYIGKELEDENPRQPIKYSGGIKRLEECS